MIEITQLKPQTLAGVRVVCTDIDDTVSSGGKLTAEAYGAMWRLHEAGYRVVAVTGRPAGWCDHIARFWPVDAVVGENGGFYFWHDGQRLRSRYLYGDAARAEFRRRLQGVRERILAEVHGCAIASDQQYREYDLAVDFCEDVPALERRDVMKIKTLFEEAGAHAKISSIHVNGWFGDFDKLGTTRLCAAELFGMDVDTQNRAFVFCGDSPNDEPMFRFFELTFGMANLRPFLDVIEHEPAFIATEESGAGFTQVTDLLLKAKEGGSA